MVTRTPRFSAMLFAAVSPFGLNTAHAAGDAVIAWNANAGAAAIKACMNALDGNDPFHESRMYAMMHIAIHDALNGIDRKYQPYAFDKKAEQGASPDAAVAAAAHDVLVPTIGQLPPDLFKKECTDAGTAVAEASYTAALAAIPDGAPKDHGIAVGRASAAAILAKRAHDEDKVTPLLNKNCPAPSDPGKFQCVPGFPFVAFERWETVTPFVLQDNTQFRPGPPYAVTDPAFAADLKEVQSLGGDGKSTPSARTDDQTQIALFWLENSPLKWSRIARTVATEKGLKPWENARLFAVLNMALADGYIAMAASKNHYNFWRPVTAIQGSGDKNWTPLVPTPPDQDYPSGHSIEGGVGAEVLKRLFGTDQVSFQDCGTTLPAGSRCGDPTPIMRSYTSFTQAADENAYSRVLVGFHFRNATKVGTEYGRQIGERAATLLAPIQ
jgi:PAP2 superfamily